MINGYLGYFMAYNYMYKLQGCKSRCGAEGVAAAWCQPKCSCGAAQLSKCMASSFCPPMILSCWPLCRDAQTAKSIAMTYWTLPFLKETTEHRQAPHRIATVQSNSVMEEEQTPGLHRTSRPPALCSPLALRSRSPEPSTRKPVCCYERREVTIT